VDRKDITTREDACLRSHLDHNRINLLESRARRFAQFPPLILFKAQDGTLVLIDGWNRVVVYDRLRINVIPALVIDTSLEEALIAGLRMNIPKDGKLRGGDDAARALNILATALGRTITEPEAVSLGLQHSENEPLLPRLIKLMGMPHLPAPAQSSPTNNKKSLPSKPLVARLQIHE
jgi:hypothetical protein